MERRRSPGHTYYTRNVFVSFFHHSKANPGLNPRLRTYYHFQGRIYWERDVFEIHQIVPSDVEQAVAHGVMKTTLAQLHKPKK